MLEIKDGKLFKDGKEHHIRSGAVHYFRTLPEYWLDRLQKLKAAGLNTVETYTCWNLHEPQKGRFDFEGRLDICRFIETAASLGLDVILRPGPYICAEWDLGGLPAWLLKDGTIRLRCNDPVFVAHERDYLKELFARVGKYLACNGGNIVAVQIENEYGSFANDKDYLRAVEGIFDECGVNVLRFTSDGPCGWMLSGGTLPGVWKTLNFGSGGSHAFGSLERFKEKAPKMCMEFWCGWFDHWGFVHHRQNIKLVGEISHMLANDINFNIYMFHGGTNFGFTAGANHFKKYQPTVTSYDYGALLTEWGDYTPNYHAVRKMIFDHLHETPPPLPPRPTLQNVGTVQLTERGSLWDNLGALGTVHRSPMPEPMEHYGQNSGMILYSVVVEGKYERSFVTFDELRDRGYLFVDGRHVKTFDYRKKDMISRVYGKPTAIVEPFDGKKRFDLLVDVMGHVNYGEHIKDRKGISGMRIINQHVNGFEVTTLPLDDVSKVEYSGGDKYPVFLRGKFRADSKGDCFVQMKGFGKGVVWVNGFNLGRYWSIGPQRALYLPGSLLKGENEIVIMELEKAKGSVEITDKPKLS